MARIIQSDIYAPVNGETLDLLPGMRDDFTIPIWISVQAWVITPDTGSVQLVLVYDDPTGQTRELPFGLIDLSDPTGISDINGSKVSVFQRQSATSDCYIRVDASTPGSSVIGVRIKHSDEYNENVGYTDFLPS